MAIKTTIQALITSLIRSNPSLIDKTEHADVEDALLLNSYATVINETNLSNSITEENSSYPDIIYNIYIAKQGRKVTIKGSVFNGSAFIIDGAGNYIFEIVNSEYFTNIAINNDGGFPTLCATLSSDPINVYFRDNKLCVENLGSNQEAFLNIEYLTEN